MNDDVTIDGAPATVLLIDDGDTNRYVLASWLKRAGHSVIEAGDGTQALALLDSPGSGAPRPEVAIVDVRLPDMSGFEVCEQIKARPSTASLPVIHVSAVAVAAEDRTEGLHRGADAYLIQPVDPQELLATVTATLRYTRARRRAERLAVRLTVLNRTTLDLYKAPDFGALTAAATTGAATLMSSAATVVFLTSEGRAVHSTIAGPDAAPRSGDATADLLNRLAAPALGAASTGAEIATVPRAEWRALLPSDHLDDDVVLVAARTKHGRPPVCLAVPARAARGNDDRELFQQLAHACALSLEALRAYNEEHSLALTLQRTFLPDRLPAVPGIDLAVRYLPATTHAEIGGDFYEAVETADGLLLAIGDIAGHSLAAATVMGEVRHALHAYAREGHPPHHILDRLDTLLAQSRPGVAVTVCLVLVEPDRRRVHISNAGHMPPLLLGPDGRATFVHDHSTLLGLGLPHPAPVVLATAPGTRLVLITDGLVEVRAENLYDSLDGFRAAALSGPAELEALCDYLLLTFGKDKDDDIALLSVRLT